MGRRVEKKVYTGSVGNWTLGKHLKFVYDGFLQIEELDGASSDAVLKKRIWGNNKIIADIHGSSTYYALGDANKNISEYIDATGTVQAHYEFSPFGKITSQTGTLQNDFDFRFSSEYLDTETGMVYYNFRYYIPELGRWLNRDPIGELVGMRLNLLYNYNINSPLNYIDNLGLEIVITVYEAGKKAIVDRYKRHRQSINRPLSGPHTRVITKNHSFHVEYKGGCKCKNGKDGRIILKQEIQRTPLWSDKYWENEGQVKPQKVKCKKKVITHQPDYRDAAGEAAGGCPGFTPDSYIDIPQYNNTFRATAYCRCDCEDDRFLESRSFSWKTDGTLKYLR